MIYRALSRVLVIVALALSSVAIWVWLFYAEYSALWWRREYVYAALICVVFIGVAVSFVRARRGKSIARAAIDTGVMLLGCAGVVAISYLLAAWFGPQLLR